MPAVDRTILRIGAFELLCADEVDDAVAIDEAVVLARELSTDDCPRFVNGVLGRISDIAEHLRAARDPARPPSGARRQGAGRASGGSTPHSTSCSDRSPGVMS